MTATVTEVQYLKVGDIGRRVRVIQGESILVGPLRRVSAEVSEMLYTFNGPAHYAYSISLQVGQFDITAQPNTPLDFLEEDE